MFKDFFERIEPIKIREPLANTLGALKEKVAILEYSFIDTVKMAGHACPTVASAYIGCKKALEVLYPEEIPVRGDISITVYGESAEGVYGVMAQVFSFITGACLSTGFKGLGYKFKRKDLLRFTPDKIDTGALCFEFGRLDKQGKVLIKLFPAKFPSLGDREHRMGKLLEKIIWEAAKDDELEEFQNLWMEKVKRIVLDEEEIHNWLILKHVEA